MTETPRDPHGEAVTHPPPRSDAAHLPAYAGAAPSQPYGWSRGRPAIPHAREIQCAVLGRGQRNVRWHVGGLCHGRRRHHLRFGALNGWTMICAEMALAA